jgi:hypothetical protein
LAGMGNFERLDIVYNYETVRNFVL